MLLQSIHHMNTEYNQYVYMNRRSWHMLLGLNPIQQDVGFTFFLFLTGQMFIFQFYLLSCIIYIIMLIKTMVGFITLHLQFEKAKTFISHIEMVIIL